MQFMTIELSENPKDEGDSRWSRPGTVESDRLQRKRSRRGSAHGAEWAAIMHNALPSAVSAAVGV